VKIAILPFQTFDAFDSRVAFVDNIGQILSAEISHLPDFSVLSYYTTQQLHLKNRDIKSIASDYGVNYVLVGNLHFESSRLRVTIQFINAATEMLIWSDNHMYELARISLFEITDLIVSRVMNSMTEFNDRLNKPAREVIELKRDPGTKKIASF
jgi:TolB-like protein